MGKFLRLHPRILLLMRQPFDYLSYYSHSYSLKRLSVGMRNVLRHTKNAKLFTNGNRYRVSSSIVSLEQSVVITGKFSIRKLFGVEKRKNTLNSVQHDVWIEFIVLRLSSRSWNKFSMLKLNAWIHGKDSFHPFPSMTNSCKLHPSMDSIHSNREAIQQRMFYLPHHTLSFNLITPCVGSHRKLVSSSSSCSVKRVKWKNCYFIIDE